MENAKAAVSKFLSKDGKHDTTVHETINPAVTNEHVTRKQHNETTTVVDREIHQHHHHTSVQPIKDREILPEKHTHNLAGVEHREIHHGNSDHVKESIAAERAQFKNTREVGKTQHTSAAAPVIAGEHIHHHIYETIQPVVQKETIQPSVTHTTIPIHEVHYNKAKIAQTSALPAMTMDEFQKTGNVLGGTQHRKDSFEGEPEGLGKMMNPRNELGTIGGPGADGTTSMTGDLDPKVAPNRGSVPATSAQNNVSARNDGATARNKIDASLPVRHHESLSSGTGTTSMNPLKSSPITGTSSKSVGTGPTSPKYSTSSNNTSSRIDNNSAHVVPRSEVTKAESTTSHGSGKPGLLEKIKNAIH